MNQDDDVERLFSWLQTPDLRYREFAGAREVTDAVATWEGRSNTRVVEVAPEETAPPTPTAEIRPQGAGPSPGPAREAAAHEAAMREPAIIAPTPTPAPRMAESQPLGPAVRAASPGPEIARNPEPPPTAQPPSVQTTSAEPATTHERHGEGATNPDGSPPQQSRPLDAVFGRLAGGSARPPDPRERLRHIPGLNPPPRRSR